MNFDLSWFTTIPGLFITAGVILLIIALIILIITGKKSKKEKKAKEAKQEEKVAFRLRRRQMGMLQTQAGICHPA